ADVQIRYGLRVFEPSVPRSVRFAEAPAAGRSIIDHAPSSVGAAAYNEIAHTIAVEAGIITPAPEHSDVPDHSDAGGVVQI
ncbi:MAG: ParA family protein, partial [Actinomycetes bacterium]